MRRFALPITTNENLMNITRMTLAVTTTGLLLTATAVAQPVPPAVTFPSPLTAVTSAFQKTTSARLP